MAGLTVEEISHVAFMRPVVVSHKKAFSLLRLQVHGSENATPPVNGREARVQVAFGSSAAKRLPGPGEQRAWRIQKQHARIFHLLPCTGSSAFP